MLRNAFVVENVRKLPIRRRHHRAYAKGFGKIRILKYNYYNLKINKFMLRTIRLITAIVCFTLITLLFLDFMGIFHMVRMAGENSISAGPISLEHRCWSYF